MKSENEYRAKKKKSSTENWENSNCYKTSQLELVMEEVHQDEECEEKKSEEEEEEEVHQDEEPEEKKSEEEEREDEEEVKVDVDDTCAEPESHTDVITH